MRKLIIAIDGPSGAGKGTVARAVAETLGYRRVDSGAMYRAVAWLALDRHVPLDDEEALAGLAERARIEIDGQRVTIDDVDVTRDIRTPRIDSAAAAVARLSRVRVVLVDRQRELGLGGGIVMEGRDIGTVVFPGGDVKIYLDAAPEERARRRAADPAHSGPTAVAEVVSAISERDRIDRTRQVSPLYAAPDATVIDTTGKAVDEVVKTILAIAQVRVATP